MASPIHWWELLHWQLGAHIFWHLQYMQHLPDTKCSNPWWVRENRHPRKSWHSTRLKAIVSPEVIAELERAVLLAHDIFKRTSLLLKAYCLQADPFPKVNFSLVRHCMNCVCTRNARPKGELLGEDVGKRSSVLPIPSDWKEERGLSVLKQLQAQQLLDCRKRRMSLTMIMVTSEKKTQHSHHGLRERWEAEVHLQAEEIREHEQIWISTSEREEEMGCGALRFLTNRAVQQSTSITWKPKPEWMHWPEVFTSRNYGTIGTFASTAEGGAVKICSSTGWQWPMVKTAWSFMVIGSEGTIWKAADLLLLIPPERCLKRGFAWWMWMNTKPLICNLAPHIQKKNGSLLYARLCCTNCRLENKRSKRFVNRDDNAARNILWVGNVPDRPACLQTFIPWPPGHFQGSIKWPTFLRLGWTVGP